MLNITKVLVGDSGMLFGGEKREGEGTKVRDTHKAGLLKF